MSNAAKKTMQTQMEMVNDSGNRATYCPEDNKLRLYVGRVPRDEYEALRKEGWTSTPKQDCDFVAHWTPERRDTALDYAGIIEDEDQPPEERAADRAERFSGYLDKRIDDATGHADRYDSQPSAHGFQNERRAERAAQRHDRIATRATDAWGKAEYWQRRTAGVIANALHKSSPAVRMGRIKEIEADIRRIEASHKKAHAEFALTHSVMLALVEHAEGKREKMAAFPGWQYSISYIREADKLAEDATFTPEQTRRCMISAAFAGEYSGRWQELRKQAQAGTIEAAAVAREWLDAKGWETPKPFDFTKGDWHQHLTLRLAYENQMLEAQGGRAAFVEMEVGGWVGSHQIRKVNKSNATGRVVSVTIAAPTRANFDKKGQPYSETNPRPMTLHTLTVERMAADIYRPPTDEERAALIATKKAEKAAAPKKDPCPLVNPLDDEAEDLQAILNERAKADHCRRHLKAYGRDYADQFKPSTVCRIPQGTYSAASQGSYARAETRGLCRDAELEDRRTNMYCREEKERRERIGKPVCQIRITGSDGSDYGAKRVIVLTDKPQKALPAAVWEAYTAPQTVNA